MQRIIILGITLVLLSAMPSAAAVLNDRPNCIRFGFPAVCYNSAVAKAAAHIAAKRCPRKGFDHDAWASSIDINEGPYRDPKALAETVCMIAH